MYSGVLPTISPAMNTERIAMISRPLRPTPTPPGLTSPSIMWDSGTAPPNGVKLSCMEFTEPFEVPVVEAAQSPEAAGPNRTLLALGVSACLFGGGRLRSAEGLQTRVAAGLQAHGQ